MAQPYQNLYNALIKIADIPWMQSTRKLLTKMRKNKTVLTRDNSMPSYGGVATRKHLNILKNSGFDPNNKIPIPKRLPKGLYKFVNVPRKLDSAYPEAYQKLEAAAKPVTKLFHENGHVTNFSKNKNIKNKKLDVMPTPNQVFKRERIANSNALQNIGNKQDRLNYIDNIESMNKLNKELNPSEEYRNLIGTKKPYVRN